MYYIPFNYFTISLLIGGFTALISGFVVISHDHRRPVNQAWFALTMSTAIWSFAYFYMTIALTKEQGFLGNWILHYAAIFIPLFYFFLVLTLIDGVRKHKIRFIFYTLLAFIFTTINLSPSFIENVTPKVGFNFAPVPGPLYIFYFIFFVVLVADGLLLTYFAARKSAESDVKSRLYYTMFFTITAAVGGGSVFATTFFNSIAPYPLILFSIYPAISGYAVLRYQLFDVRVVTAQIINFVVWIFIFVRILLSENLKEQIANIILLMVTMVLGILLNKSVKKEVKQREHIQKLADDLEKANVHLTELNRQKSEFVSFATHQLRAPLTAMKGYSSLLLEGDMGQLQPDAKKGIQNIFESAKTLTNIVDDYLNVSRIELGTMKYAFETVDLKQLIDSVIGELKPNIDKTKLGFSFKTENSDLGYRITADRDKLKQVIANLIDNSIKYTPSGKVDVSLAYDKMGHKFVFKIKDTGVGISPEVQKHLFQKFTRAANANKVNIRGTGLGLYVARQIVEAHHGVIKVESAGEGKGSTFTVELEPMMRA